MIEALVIIWLIRALFQGTSTLLIASSSSVASEA
jgi:hypothetical protein